MPVERLVLYRLRLPLAVPYKLALGVVHAFDTILVVARDAEGRTGLGEATILTGYTGETIEEGWRLACALAAKTAGAAPAEARDIIAPHRRAAPFTTTAVTTAIEMLEDHPLLRVAEPARIPLLAIVNAMDEAAIEAEIEARLAEGYGTLKVKVGFDMERDLGRVRFVQRRVGGRALVRIDGNQGYGRDEACRFAAALAPDGIELFEQPCAAGDWDAAKAVAGASAVPMMLDESIYGIADIERAADLGAAAFIKLKLMKAGGLERLAAGLARIRALGMTPVLGNGVAGEVGCWMEACAARAHIDNAGEMNGFLKPRAGILRAPLVVEDGGLVLDPAWRPEIDPAAVAAAAVETAAFSGARTGA